MSPSFWMCQQLWHITRHKRARPAEGGRIEETPFGRPLWPTNLSGANLNRSFEAIASLPGVTWMPCGTSGDSRDGDVPE